MRRRRWAAVGGSAQPSLAAMPFVTSMVSTRTLKARRRPGPKCSGPKSHIRLRVGGTRHDGSTEAGSVPGHLPTYLGVSNGTRDARWRPCRANGQSRPDGMEAPLTPPSFYLESGPRLGVACPPVREKPCDPDAIHRHAQRLRGRHQAASGMNRYTSVRRGRPWKPNSMRLHPERGPSTNPAGRDDHVLRCPRTRTAAPFSARPTPWRFLTAAPTPHALPERKQPRWVWMDGAAVMPIH